MLFGLVKILLTGPWYTNVPVRFFMGATIGFSDNVGEDLLLQYLTNPIGLDEMYA